MKKLPLSKFISHALRHSPWEYELELDSEGWVEITHLLNALRNQKSEWGDLKIDDLHQLIANSSKTRFEIQENKIRALYGHSLSGKLLRKISAPPEILYHGTSHKAINNIKDKGLLPNGRQYVHLSTNIEMAKTVGLRKDPDPIILTIDAEKASADDIKFYIGNEQVWLADCVPPKYILF